MSNTKASRVNIPPMASIRGIGSVDVDDLDMTGEHMAEFEDVIRRQLELIGEDPAREGLLKTPSRVAKSLSRTW